MMTHKPMIRTLAAHEWQLYKDLRLRALADAPYAFGRTLTEALQMPDPEWARRLSAGADSRWNLPLVAEVAGEAVGLTWGHIDETDPLTAYLYQMWVSPGSRGLGAGKLLVQAVIDWVRENGACTLKLGVTQGNRPAWRLYTRAGFEPTGSSQPLRKGSALQEQPMRLKLRDCAG